MGLATLASLVAFLPEAAAAHDEEASPSLRIAGGLAAYPGAETVGGNVAVSAGLRYELDLDVGLSVDLGYLYVSPTGTEAHYGVLQLGADVEVDWTQYGVVTALLVGSDGSRPSVGGRFGLRIEPLWGAVSFEGGYEVRSHEPGILHGAYLSVAIDVLLIAWGLARFASGGALAWW